MELVFGNDLKLSKGLKIWGLQSLVKQYAPQVEGYQMSISCHYTMYIVMFMHVYVTITKAELKQSYLVVGGSNSAFRHFI